MKPPSDSESVRARELQPIIADTETVTQNEIAPPELTQLEAALAECRRLEQAKLEADAAADKRLRQVKSEYGVRLIQLEQDASAERDVNEKLSKKIEALELSLAEQAQGLRPIDQQVFESTAALEKSKAEFGALQLRHQALETEVAGIRHERDEFQSKLRLSQTAEQQAKSQTAELTARLEQTSSELRTLRTGAEKTQAAQKQLTADLDKEREANKVSRQKAEELNSQLKNLQQAAEQAEARVRESAARCSDWEKKAAELKKSFDELTRNHAVEQSAAAKSAQRVKELEEQLKGANTGLAASKTEVEKRNTTLQRLEAENRSLTEANTKAKAELDKEREANKVSRQKAEELSTQVKNLQRATEQAEARARESAARCGDWEKKAADLKKTADELGVKTKAELDKEREANKISRQKTEELSTQLKNSQHASEQAEARVRESAARCSDWEKKAADLRKALDELARSHAAEQSAAAKSVQRAKEFEQQLQSANADLAAGRAEAEKQNLGRQRLEAENRSLAEANTKASAELAEFAKNGASQKRVSELEQRVHEGVSALAKITAELQSERAERERAEKCASSAAEHLQQVNEKLNRHLESNRASRSQIAELEKTIHDRGDALARASAALRRETKERHLAEKQLRLVSEIGTRLESNLGSLEEAKKSFDVSLSQKDERFLAVERSLADANAKLEKELAERRRLEGLLAEAQRQLEKQSGESKVEIPRLRAALELAELQRKRLEGGLLRSREIATNAEQGQGLMLDSLRRELRQPVEDLRQSACRLLESQVTDEQKRAIETVLEKALFLQVTLNAVAQPDSESHPQASGRRADSRDKKNGAK